LSDLARTTAKALAHDFDRLNRDFSKKTFIMQQFVCEDNRKQEKKGKERGQPLT
jgi:hypothetical protein